MNISYAHCTNCDYTWTARVPKPKECPSCHRYTVEVKEVTYVLKEDTPAGIIRESGPVYPTTE